MRSTCENTVVDRLLASCQASLATSRFGCSSHFSSFVRYFADIDFQKRSLIVGGRLGAGGAIGRRRDGQVRALWFLLLRNRYNSALNSSWPLYIRFLSTYYLLPTILVHQVSVSARAGGCSRREMEPFEVSFQLSPSFLDNFHHFLGSEIMLTCFVDMRREGYITDLPESSVHQLFRRSSSRVAAASCWSCFFCVSLVFSQVFLLLELSRVRGASSLARPGCLWQLLSPRQR